ncbi:MAG TPA: sialidase family protein [Pyrinomonadaceae bacterium]|nr:sialidase family protein [Pyrinomonadaceae bacterium]
MKTLAFIAVLLLSLCAGCARVSVVKHLDAQASAAPSDALVEASERVRVSAEGLNAAEPALAAGRDGAVYVAWVGHGAGKEADVWLTRIADASGRPVGEPARVNPRPGEATAWRGDAPSVAVLAEGAVYVAWTARAGEGGQATTLYVSCSRDGGRSFGEPARVNDDSAPGVHGMHSLAVGSDGRVYVAWLDERDHAAAQDGAHAPGQASGRMPMHGEHNREVFFSYSTDGARTFAANRRVAAEACPCCKTSLAVSVDGRVYVGWRQVLPGDFRHIAVASSADGGETFDAPTVVSDDRWELRGCPVSGPALAAGEGGRLTVLWFTAGDAGAAGLYSAESGDGGRTFAPRRAVSEVGARGTPQLLRDASGAFAVFEAEGEGGSPAMFEARLDEAERDAARATSNRRTRIGAGALPVAAVLGGRIYAAYVSNGGVWLTSYKAG